MPPADVRSTIPTGTPVRVLTLLKGLSRGGAESLALLGATHRDDRDISHSLAYVSAAHHELADAVAAQGVPVTCLGGGAAWNPSWMWRLRRQMVASDVVHTHSPVPAVGARLVSRTISKKRRPKLLSSEHNVWDSHHPLTRRAEDLTFDLDDAHLAVSDAVRRSLPPAKAAQVEVVVQGVDLPAVRAAADRDGARRELGVADDEVLIGTVANLRPQKGYPDLLRAAAAVLAEVPEARFVAMGGGPQEDEIAALHRDLALGSRFLLLGRREDAVRLMSGFDVFCMSSHHEGLPVALMEALALGLPVAVTRAGGIDELVTDGEEGRIVEPRRPDALASALVAMATDDTTRKAHAQRAAERGESLSVLTSVRRHEELYRQLAGRTGG